MNVRRKRDEKFLLENPNDEARSGNDPMEHIKSTITNCQQRVGGNMDQGIIFPKDVIKGMAKEFADLYQEFECPSEFLALSFLTCLGSLLADRITLNSELKPQPRLYTILLGESGTTHKSWAIEQAASLFSETFPHEFATCDGVGSGEGLAEVLSKKNKMVLTLDEFKTFIAKSVHQTSILLPCVNSLFDKNRYESQTKNRPLIVESGYLSILAGSTPDTFLNMFSPKFGDIGFFNRLFLVPGEGEGKNAIPGKVDRKSKAALKTRLRTIYDSLPKGIREIRMSSLAKETFQDWYEEAPNSPHQTRLDTYGHRLMLLFCINEDAEKIESDLVLRIIKLLKWQLLVRRANDPIQAEAKIARLEELIRRALMSSGQLNKRDLKRKIHAERYGVELFDHALKNLQKVGDVKFDQESKTYRYTRKEP